MFEKPPIADDRIIVCLRAGYGLQVAHLDFLALGADVNAGVFRVETTEGRTFFLKVRRGIAYDPALAIPHFLRDGGITQIAAPLPARDGRLWQELEGFALILYPFIQGHPAMEVGLTDEQWTEVGAVLRQVHAAQLPPALASQMRRETFLPRWVDGVRAFQEQLRCGEPEGDTQRELAAFWRSRAGDIDRLCDRTVALAGHMRGRTLPYVLCHADIHVANMLVDDAGQVWIVDWDETMLAPKERDLMFILGGLGGSMAVTPAQQATFFQGYGPAEVDPVALAYYRYDWAVQDAGEWARLVLRAEVGQETKENALRIFRGVFGPGDEVELAFATEAGLPAELRDAQDRGDAE